MVRSGNHGRRLVGAATPLQKHAANNDSHITKCNSAISIKVKTSIIRSVFRDVMDD